MSQETNKPGGNVKPGFTPEIKKQETVKAGASETTMAPAAANKPEAQPERKAV